MAVDDIAFSPRSADRETVRRNVQLPLQGNQGNVRLRHHETDEIILIPTPSDDPNDPLNWPQWYKRSITVVVCAAILWCNFLAAGPSVAIVATTLDFFPASPPNVDPAGFNINVAKVAYFFTSTSLLLGVSNFFWVPLANKYGRRPVYVASYVIYLASAVWAIFDTSFEGFLAARIMIGVGAGAAETIAPITISDVFFLHERGTVMSLYSSFLSVGVGFGMIISGLITINHNWRVIYEVASAFIGLLLLVAFFAFPETAFSRGEAPGPEYHGHQPQQLPSRKSDAIADGIKEKDLETLDLEHLVASTSTSPRRPKRKTFVQMLALYNGTFTAEPLYKIFLRPFGLICLPPVLWSALVQSVTIGFLVAVSSNVGAAFETAYGFESWQVGLCFISACVGSLVGIPAGGQLGDFVADYFTRRNGGIRTPEMRLPAMMLSLVTAPLALLLYGVGIEKRLHWICPTIGLGLMNFSIVQGCNVSLVYVIDAYRPVAGEVTLAVMGFKSLFGFLLSFYTNPWVDSAGYQSAYGAMAGISAAVIVLWVPLYVWGRRIRSVTWNWPVISYIHWSGDREVGE